MLFFQAEMKIERSMQNREGEAAGEVDAIGRADLNLLFDRFELTEMR